MYFICDRRNYFNNSITYKATTYAGFYIKYTLAEEKLSTEKKKKIYQKNFINKFFMFDKIKFIV